MIKLTRAACLAAVFNAIVLTFFGFVHGQAKPTVPAIVVYQAPG